MKYRVTIKATILKTYEVEAQNESEAEYIANKCFSVCVDDAEEHDDQNVIETQLIESDVFSTESLEKISSCIHCNGYFKQEKDNHDAFCPVCKEFYSQPGRM